MSENGVFFFWDCLGLQYINWCHLCWSQWFDYSLLSLNRFTLFSNRQLWLLVCIFIPYQIIKLVLDILDDIFFVIIFMLWYRLLLCLLLNLLFIFGLQDKLLTFLFSPYYVSPIWPCSRTWWCKKETWIRTASGCLILQCL